MWLLRACMRMCVHRAHRQLAHRRDLGNNAYYSNGNRISGTLPASLSALTELQDLCRPPARPRSPCRCGRGRLHERTRACADTCTDLRSVCISTQAQARAPAHQHLRVAGNRSPPALARCILFVIVCVCASLCVASCVPPRRPPALAGSERARAHASMHAFRVRRRHRDLGSPSSDRNFISGTLPSSLSALTALTSLCAHARLPALACSE